MTTQELIKDFGDYAIVSLWNRYVDENNLGERVYLNLPDEINKAFSTPYDVALAMSHGDWYPTDISFSTGSAISSHLTIGMTSRVP